MTEQISRRRILGTATTLVSAIAAYFATIPFVRSFLPSARARALGEPIEIDLSSILPGDVKPFVYRGRTILVLRRTPEMLAAIGETEAFVPASAAVEDPAYAANDGRSILPEFLVVEGVCTHFGCVPRLTGAAQGRSAIGDWWKGGFICPCHTSGYDYAGRVVRGPAPRNLPIPPHRYVATNRIVVGEEPEAT